jgi:hypothetical protein
LFNFFSKSLKSDNILDTTLNNGDKIILSEPQEYDFIDNELSENNPEIDYFVFRYFQNSNDSLPKYSDAGLFFRIFKLIPASNFSCVYRDNQLILSGDINFFFQPKNTSLKEDYLINYFVLEDVILSFKNVQLCFKNIDFTNQFLVNKGNYFSETDIKKILPNIVIDI